MMKEREGRWKLVAERQAKRGDSQSWYSAVDAATMSTQMSIAAAGQVGRAGRTAPAPKGPTKRERAHPARFGQRAQRHARRDGGPP